jgi:DHA2 family multidrug resistance protein-like MFS transporter
MVCFMVLGGMGIGLAFTVNNDNVLATAPKDRSGAAAAVSETSFELGGALGIAILGTVLNTTYANRLAVPAGVPGEPVRESLAGALAVAETLPAEQAGQLAAAARVAFVEAVRVTALTTSSMLVVVALLALVGLRGVPKVIPEEDLARAR